MWKSGLVVLSLASFLTRMMKCACSLHFLSSGIFIFVIDREAGDAHKTSRMKNESNAAASVSGNRATENTGRQPSSSSSAPVATTGESPPGEQGSGGGDADGSDDDSDDTGVHIGRVASVEAEEINRADAASKEALNGAGSRRPAAGVAEGRNSGNEGRAAAATTGLADGMSAARRLGRGSVGGDYGGVGDHAGGDGDNASGMHGAKRPRKKVRELFFFFKMVFRVGRVACPLAIRGRNLRCEI